MQIALQYRKALVWIAWTLLGSFSAAAQAPDAASPLFIEAINPDSLAGKAGLNVGDLILRYDGKTVSPAGLSAAMQYTLGKNEIRLDIQRQGTALTFTVPAGSLGVQVRPDLAPTVLALYMEGKKAADAQREDGNIAMWTSAAKAAEDAGKNDHAAWLYAQVGRIHQAQQRWREAREPYRAAWELMKGSRDAAAQSQIVTAIGIFSHNLNDLAEAKRWFGQALELDMALGYEGLNAINLNNLGNIARSQTDFAAARDYYSRALRIRERLEPESLNVAGALTNIGALAYQQSDLQAAQGYFSRALAIREKIQPASQAVVSSLVNLGDTALMLGNIEAATNFYSRGLVLGEKVAPDSLILAEILRGLGRIARNRGQVDVMERYFDRALALFESKAPDSLQRATTLIDLATVAADRGDLKSAQDLLNRALAIGERIAPKSLETAQILNALGNVTRNHGDIDTSLDLLQRSLAIRERIVPGTLTIAETLNNLALTLKANGDVDGAIDLYQRALAIKERLAPNSPTVASSLQNLAVVLIDRGELSAAEDYLSRALEIKEQIAPNGSVSVATLIDELGRAASKRGDAQSAEQHFRRALGMYEKFAPGHLSQAETLMHLGNLFLRERRVVEARSLLSRAVDIIERHRAQIAFAESRALLVARNREAFSGLVRAHIELGDHAAAFATVERARARSLLDLLAEANVDINEGLAPDLKQRERAVHSRIAEVQRALIEAYSRTSPAAAEVALLEEQLKEIERERQQLQIKIRQEHPKYAELHYPSAFDLKAVQAHLDPDTTLLEYSLSEDGSFLFVITKTDHFVAKLPSASSLSDRVKRLRETLIRKPQRSTVTTYLEQSRALYRLLVEPARKSLANKHQLIIVPDGILHYLPFEVLLSSGDQRSLIDTAPSRWPYLLREFAVSYVQSATVLASLQRSREARSGPQQNDLLAYADPAYGAAGEAQSSTVGSALRSAFGDVRPWRLERLPYSQEEAKRIAALYPPEKVSVLLQDDAREEHVKAKAALSQYRFIHFAVHGLLNEARPQFSGLILSLPAEESPLSTPSEEDGLLQVYEIFNLKLNAELVVLSACETGLGKEVKGEGLVGLTRAFLYAGTPSVVVSLWNVSDRSTEQLMFSFYQHLKERGSSKSQALRQAQLKLIEGGRYAEPFYWAPFILVGDAN